MRLPSRSALSHLSILVLLFGLMSPRLGLSQEQILKSGSGDRALPSPRNEVQLEFRSDPLEVAGTQLIWPTNASRILTSTFGETRAAHLHAGIDIRTWGREGYEVYAMADGDVMRLQTGPKGYGNAVYLRHSDGTISMSAHLNRFEPLLQAYADSIRLASHHASMDLYPLERTFSYKAGDLIGFTGSTGTGPPHLHVELRNEQNQPLNPLLSSLRGDVKDNLAPEFEALAVEHLHPTSYHLQRHQVLVGQKIQVGQDVLVGQEVMNRTDFGTVEVSGPVGISALMHDRANGTKSRYAVYEWMMMVREDTVFHARADWFPFSMDQKMFLDRSYPILAETGDGFQRFYVVNGNRLPLYRSMKNRGVLHFAPGEYEVRLIAKDIFGNRSESLLTVRAAGEVVHLDEHPKEYLGEHLGEHEDGHLHLGEHLGEHLSGHQNENPDVYLFKVDSVPAYPLPSVDRVRVDRPFARYPAHKVVEPEALFHQPEKEKILSQGRAFHRIYTHLFLESGWQPLPEDSPVRIRAELSPGHSTMLHTPDQRVQLLIPRNAIYDSLEVVMQVAWQDGLPEITFDPGGLPVFEDLRLRVRLPDSVDADQKVGVFGRHPRSGKLIFLGAQRAGSWVESPMMEIADVVLVQDDEAPVVQVPSLRRNLAGKMVVTVMVRDDESGIDPDESHIFLDGVRGITEFDPDKKELIYVHPSLTPDRSMEVRVEVQDGVGNRSVVRYAGGRW